MPLRGDVIANIKDDARAFINRTIAFVWVGNHTHAAGTIFTTKGGRRINQRTITETETITITDEIIFANATSGNIVTNLPTAVNNDGQILDIKKIDSSGNTVTLDPFGSETIDEGATQIISAQFDSITIVSNNSNWFII